MSLMKAFTVPQILEVGSFIEFLQLRSTEKLFLERGALIGGTKLSFEFYVISEQYKYKSEKECKT